MLLQLVRNEPPALQTLIKVEYVALVTIRGTLYRDFVGQRTFYGYLASQRYELFRDADFAKLYCQDNGRPSVPPSLLATALVLQTYDGVSDEEAKQRADYDLRWKVALGIEVEIVFLDGVYVRSDK